MAGRVEILTGSNYESRSPSDRVGINHIVGVCLNNITGRLLTGARVVIYNLSPPDNSGNRIFLVKSNLTLSHDDPVVVNLAVYNEEACNGTMLLQYEELGSLVADGYGMIVGEHKFDLCFTCDQSFTTRIRCRLYVDDLNVMRLERLDERVQNGL